MDGNARTLLKTISYRVIATVTTMVIVYLYTREMALSFGVGIRSSQQKSSEVTWETGKCCNQSY